MTVADSLVVGDGAAVTGGPAVAGGSAISERLAVVDGPEAAPVEHLATAPLELLAGRVEDIRRLAGSFIRRRGLTHSDFEEVVELALERCAKALRKRRSVSEGEIRAMLAANVAWAVEDLRRAARERGAHELLTDPWELPEVIFEPEPCPAEQTEAVQALLWPLSGLEREVLYEHAAEGMSFPEIAAKHQSTLAAVQKLASRARAKVREQVVMGHLACSTRGQRAPGTSTMGPVDSCSKERSA